MPLASRRVTGGDYTCAGITRTDTDQAHQRTPLGSALYQPEGRGPVSPAHILTILALYDSRSV